MSRSRRPAAVALLVGVALATGASPSRAQDAPTGTPDRADVLDLTLPVLDLEAPVASLDGSLTSSAGGREERITLAADVLFRFDRADLGGRARSRIADVARRIERADPRTVRITGHTDDRGTDAYNDRLSRRRADAVRRALLRELGPGGPRLRAEGRGESDPVAANRDEDGEDAPRGRQRNRRVEIRIPRA